jgi:hypothetical protein
MISALLMFVSMLKNAASILSNVTKSNKQPHICIKMYADREKIGCNSEVKCLRNFFKNKCLTDRLGWLTINQNNNL